MSPLPHILGSLVLLAVVSFPGLMLLAATGAARRLPGVLLVPASIVVTICIGSVGTALRLAIEAPVHWLAAWLVAVTATGGVVLAWRTCTGRFCGPGLRARLARAPRWTWSAAACCALLGAWTGAGIENDTIYHASQSLKLELLEHPNFDNTLQFVDGAAHPGYLVPAWHDLLAVVAWATGLSAVEVAWLAPTVLLACFLFAWSGVGAAAFGSRVGAPAGAAAWLIVELLGTAPRLVPVEWAGQPRMIALGCCMPVLLAGMIVGVNGSDRGRRRTGLALVAVAVAAIGVVHVSYLAFAAFAIIGSSLMALRGARRRELVRHALVGLVALVAATAVVAPTLPRLASLDSFADRGAAGRVAERIDAPRGARVGRLFVGTEDSYRLRADRLVPQAGTGLAVLLLGAVSLALLARERLAWIAAGTGALVVLLGSVSPAFTAFTDVISPAQSQRLGFAVGYAPILMVVIEAGRRMVRGSLLVRWSEPRRIALWVAALVVAGAAQLAWPYRSSAGVAMDPRIAEGALGCFLVGSLALLLRARRGTPVESLPNEASPAPPPRRSLIWLAAALACVASLPTTVRAIGGAHADATPRPDGDRIDWTRRFPDEVVSGLASLGPGAVVLAAPEDSYVAMAVAPVYVSSSVPGHTANVPANRIAERHQLVVEFFVGARNDEARDEVVRRSGADAVLIDRRTAAQGVESWMSSSPLITRTVVNSGPWLLAATTP